MSGRLVHKRLKLPALIAASLLASASARAQEAQQAQPDAGAAKPSDDTAGQSTTELAKKLQNPIGNLISLPFQSNTNFSYGPNHGTREHAQHPAGDPVPHRR